MMRNAPKPRDRQAVHYCVVKRHYKFLLTNNLERSSNYAGLIQPERHCAHGVGGCWLAEASFFFPFMATCIREFAVWFQVLPEIAFLSAYVALTTPLNFIC